VGVQVPGVGMIEAIEAGLDYQGPAIESLV
jgi:hypothetical protein